MKRRTILVIILINACACVAIGQKKKAKLKNVEQYWIIKQIHIKGNKKTKERIILRELELQVGDSIFLHKKDSLLERSRNNIFNTDLFVTVELSLKTSLDSLFGDLLIEVKERWYIFPFPIFELSDRNFNEWWTTYSRDLTRVNYGLNYSHENLRGRNEKLELLAQFGFTRAFILKYTFPYIDYKQKHGLRIELDYRQNKSIAYRSDDHKLEFVESRDLLRERFKVAITLNKRNSLYYSHDFELGYRLNSISDTVRRLNERYFTNDNLNQAFFNARYKYTIDFRDVRVYPLKGWYIDLEAEKLGLGIFNDLDQFVASVNYALFTPLGEKWFLANRFKIEWTLQSEQPYNQAEALGQGSDFLRGYELYVIDGQGFFLNKNAIKFQLVNTKKHFKFIPLKQFRTVPIAMYLVAFGDTGYVRDIYFRDFSTRFSNRFIMSGGLGIDLVTYYDLVFNFNYAINSDFERGFFLGINIPL